MTNASLFNQSESSNRLSWNATVIASAIKMGAFLQSWEWGEYQRALGLKIQRLVSSSTISTTASQPEQVLAIRHPWPLGLDYWYLPKGPIGPVSESFRQQIFAACGDGIMLRYEPLAPLNWAGIKVRNHQPGRTLHLDLRPGFEHILKTMESKTRYNINLSLRHGIVARLMTPEEYPKFVTLMLETAKRGHFTPHPGPRYLELFNHFKTPEATAIMIGAFSGSKLLAATIVIDFAGTRTYLHAASTPDEREKKAPHALQAFIIQDAISRGLHTYDFWGLAPAGATDSHPWQGFSKFKQGFGGTPYEALGTYETALRPKLYSILRQLRKITG